MCLPRASFETGFGFVPGFDAGYIVKLLLFIVVKEFFRKTKN
jgi:hypothetical protein